MEELERLRKKIDAIDGEILEALNRRARVVQDIARIKRDNKKEYYSPKREKEILDRLTGMNKGPFPNEALRSLYREILSASLSLEEPLKVACLGPLATFSHLAALRHFGSSSAVVPCESIREVFEMVDKGRADVGVVPVENSSEGVVNYTLDMFIDYDLKISAEIMLEISLNLLSRSGERSRVKKIYSLQQPAAQCRLWLETNMPGVPVVEAPSTAKAAETAAAEEDAAAIASELAAEIYDLRFVERHIEDSKRNVTRFLVIAREFPPRTGSDKTSIMFSAKDKPGALCDILLPIKKAKVNMTKIESRPSKRKAWEYIFFVDMEGHVEDRKVKKAIEGLKEHCLFLKILGSYPYGG